MSLPREWSRGPQWVSPRAREEWEPVLSRAQAAWSELEVASVTEGVRDSALVDLTPAEIPVAAADCARVGLSVSVLAAEGATFRAAVHPPQLTARWFEAWTRSDDEAVGALLGFPPCCRDFFSREWVRRKSPDVTLAMRGVTGPWEANIMLRWLGVRLVPHLPCSGGCEPTLEQARAYLAAGRRVGVDVAALESLLRLPVEYDARHGVAVMTTPHFRFMAGAGADGRTSRPADAAPDAWADNGFSTATAMAEAHAVVLSTAPPAESALDLGCGDGTLLARIAAGRPGRWVGVEADDGRASRGRARNPGVTIRAGRIEDDLASDQFDVVFLTPARLLEMSADRAAGVRESLRARGGTLVLYAYGDVLAAHGGLVPLARSAGLEVTSPVREGPGAQAAEGAVI